MCVRGQLDWMIQKVNYLDHFQAFKRADYIKGEAIDAGKPLEKRVIRDFKVDEIRECKQDIYMSYNDPANLPTHAAHGKSSFRA